MPSPFAGLDPYLPGDADVLLDLQAAFTAAYDLLGDELLVHDGVNKPIVASETVTDLLSY
ncbi:MAG: hypothetical protein DYG89_29140 [Caldilinea sp. CFX5]|nr:hypothetical protein [Caldilinea sp. CFX5]